MKTPDEIKKGLKCCAYETCNGCPYAEDGCATNREMIDALEYIQQLERERDAAVETLILIPNTDCVLPCESDELACSEYCENHCSFSTPQKECWMEYFRRRCVEVE